ncbi:undecaprenyl-diphosphate phosphatase [Anaerotignum sp. MSJ-24]|uniref:undecaprenyl-diphosphate phosphatase n=1 Tax=Anaerotignum sp. MSJ-24 TaxID=2841521 RepID=UPI001C12581E|nr:undecaprenyl-diphosphate phosphatase [Anaerotignum sp. MSJ-24]MBU5463781.1 undecaprenyl-diphosphate phosphatase [Anaerotignum sp. MSJ-24]
MIEILKAIVFGIVEGITEWLPISSTGHLILLKQLMPLKVSESFWNMFEVVIQLGAILAVVLIFWHKIFPFRKERGRWHTDMRIINLWIKIIVACIPAAIIGLLFDDKINALFYNPTSVSIALIVFGVLFIVIENRNRRMRPRVTKLGQLTYQTAIIIGLFQVLAAVFPGTSRSGATIIGALLIGVSRTVAAEFTFFLAIPVMFGASLLKLIKFGFHFSGLEIGILVVGMVSAFIVSVIVIRFLMGYIKKHDFKVFGWYRIVLGIIVLLYFGLLVK